MRLFQKKNGNGIVNWRDIDRHNKKLNLINAFNKKQIEYLNMLSQIEKLQLKDENQK